MLSRCRIGARLAIGFGAGVLFTMAVGLLAMDSNDRLSRLTEDLMVHPFAVTNALRTANADIIDIRSTVKDVAYGVPSVRIDEAVSRVAGLDAEVDRQFAVVKDRYLGPAADVDKLIATYRDYKAIRDGVLAMAQDGDRAGARAKGSGPAAAAYTLLRADMETILAFAGNKAVAFMVEARRTRDDIRVLTWVIVIGAMAATTIAAWLTARSIIRPLTALRNAMGATAKGNLCITIPAVDRRDEVGEMARAVQGFQEGLAHAESLERTLRQTHKMEALGQLTGGIAHDFNNLLQVILSNLDLSLRSLGGDAVVTGHLHNAIAGAEQGAKLTGHLLAFGRRQPLNPQPLRVDRLVAEMTAMLRRTIGEHIDIEMVNAGGLWTALVDANQLQNAILNLAINARDAMPNGGKLTIELANASLDAAYADSHAEVKAGQYVQLAITDTGIGMAGDVAERAFEPFYTTKAEGVGTGLGLSMVYGFVKQSGGHVKIYSEVGHGTTVKLYLPRTQNAEVLRSPTDAPTKRGDGETILVAEDDDGVRAAAITQLAELGYRVLSAANGDDALAILARGERIDLLFTDVVMSGSLNGRALADKARGLLPDLRVVFTSGYTENAIIHHGRLDEGVRLLSKPYRLAQLADAIHSELRRPAAAATAVSVLVVEDDDKVRALTALILGELGYRIVAAATPGEALQALAADSAIGIMITDFTLPEIDGCELARRALALRPRLPVILATGRAIEPADLPDPSVLLIRKPFRAADLAAAIDEAHERQGRPGVAAMC